MEFDYFAFLYRFYLEGALDICLNIGITFAMMNRDYWSSFSMFISSTFGLANLVMICVMPIVTLVISIKYAKK